MEGGDFYQDLLAKNLVVGYIKKLEAAVTYDVLIKIRTNYLMSCISTPASHNLRNDAGLSDWNQSAERFFPAEVNTKIKEPVGIYVENHEVLSKKDLENYEDVFYFPDEVKSENSSDSELDDAYNENLSDDEPKSKRVYKIKSIPENEITHEVEEQTTDSNAFKNEEFSEEIVSNLKSNEVIMASIFKHLPLSDLLNLRTVSTDWDKKIIFHMDKNNRLQQLCVHKWNSNELIFLMMSSKQIPFTKFDLILHPGKETIQHLLTICGSSVKHLKIRISHFTEKLRQFVPNLESLYLDENSENDSNNESEDYDDGDYYRLGSFFFSKLTDIKYTVSKINFSSSETIKCHIC